MAKRNPTILRLLTFFLPISAIFSTAQAHTEVSSLLGVSPAQYCERWSGNALLGARQQLRGASREFQYVNMSTLVEMIEHGIDSTKLFLMAENYTPEERRFLEESTLIGYDRMAAFRTAKPDGGANYERWQRDLYEDCLARAC